MPADCHITQRYVPRIRSRRVSRTQSLDTETRALGPHAFLANHRLFDQVRERAFSLFEERGGGPGRDVDDWLAAEREILSSPPVQLIETDKEFQVRIAVPGFDAKEIRVTALPETIVVQAEHELVKEEAPVQVAEFGVTKVYRRLDLASPIDLDKITATLEKGVLQLIAAKAAQPKEKKIHVASAGQDA